VGTSLEARTRSELQIEAKLTVDQRSGLTIDCHTSGENKDCRPSPDSSGYPTAVPEGWGVQGFGVGVHGSVLARGVIADSRIKLLKKPVIMQRNSR